MPGVAVLAPPVRSSAPWLALLAILLAGCAGARLPEVDLTSDDWSVRTGQALWRPDPSRPPIAGEVILARRTDGDVLIEFSKPPLSIFTARTSGRRWSLELIAQGRSHSGTGRPPRRFVWFFLPQVLDGASPPAGWNARRTAAGGFRLEHSRRGETIELVLDP